MKLSLVLLLFVLISNTCLADDLTIPSSALPAGAQVESFGEQKVYNAYYKKVVDFLELQYVTLMPEDPFDKDGRIIQEVDKLFEAIKPIAEGRNLKLIWIKPKAKSGMPHKLYQYTRNDEGKWSPQLDQYGKR